MIFKIIAGLIAYLLVVVLYFFVHDYGVDFYKTHMGGFTARGVGVGITAELTFYFFIFVNFIVFWIPRILFKLFVIGLMVGVVLLYFLPENPVRAMAYGALTGSMSIVAIVARLMAERLISRSAK
ncbi:hypothetical protein [Pseudomonas syringae]|uniref:hypothetical protein n=1 Tax=Pseudomonas syringae TaxID=317 RepID=UPI000467ADCD|nr:hypothetical protein [Pseudomonas syringae]